MRFATAKNQKTSTEQNWLKSSMGKIGGGRTEVEEPGGEELVGGTLDGADRRLMSAGMTGLKTSLSLSLDVSCGSWLAL
jgi:hypothetical protein